MQNWSKNILIYSISSFMLLFNWHCKTKKPSTNNMVESTGFKEKQYRVEKDQFLQSEYLCDLSPLETLKKYKPNKKHTDLKVIDINSPSGCKSWTDCGINSNQYRHFLIMPGDYRKWGVLKLRKTDKSGEARIITYYNPAQANSFNVQLPIHTTPNADKHVILEAFDIVDADRWILNGLTFSGTSQKGKNRKGGRYNRLAAYANHNIINRCLIQNIVGDAAGIRISFSHYNCIQNSIIRDLIGSDQVGVLLKGEKDKAIGNRIINNEIYNCNDGIQLTYSTAYGEKGYLSGTIIENNDIYITQKSYSKRKSGFACAENAIDIKIGGQSALSKDVVKILKNRIWGFRPTDTSCGGSGSLGRGIVMHIKANNIILKDNVFFDLPAGINVSNKGLPTPRVAILNNLFFDIKKYDKNLKQAPAISASIDADIYYNTIKGSETSIVVQRNSASRIQCNTIIGVPQNFAWSKNKKGWAALNAWYACELHPRGVYSHDAKRNIVESRTNTKDFGDFIFYRKRWTGPQKMIVKNVFPNNQKQMKRISQGNINCSEGGTGNRWWTKCID